MNERPDTKTAITKSLAIVGVIATAGLLIWLFVQGIRVAPGAFSSLASIAESIQNYRSVPEFTVVTEKSIVNSGDVFKLSWTDLKLDGTYHFTYACTDGVTLSVRGSEGDLVPMYCGNKLSLPKDVHGLFLSITSQSQRFTDITLNVAFEKAKDGSQIAKENKITVVNAIIPTSIATDVPPDTTDTKAPTTPEAKPVTPITTPSKPVVTTPTPTTVKPTTPTVVTYYPQSNPQGFVDLRISFLQIGTIVNDTYTTTSTFDNDKKGAYKFEVKNIGTKTSDTWTVTAILPSGITYTSEPQAGLRPNEKATFTLGFDFPDTFKETSTKLVTSVTEKNDSNKANNSFSWSVKVTD